MSGHAFKKVLYNRCIQTLSILLNDNQANHLLKDKVYFFYQKLNEMLGEKFKND